MNFPYQHKTTQFCADRLNLPQIVTVVGWIRWDEKAHYYWITNNERDKNDVRIDYLINAKDLL